MKPTTLLKISAVLAILYCISGITQGIPWLGATALTLLFLSFAVLLFLLLKDHLVIEGLARRLMLSSLTISLLVLLAILASVIAKGGAHATIYSLNMMFALPSILLSCILSVLSLLLMSRQKPGLDRTSLVLMLAGSVIIHLGLAATLEQSLDWLYLPLILWTGSAWGLGLWRISGSKLIASR